MLRTNLGDGLQQFSGNYYVILRYIVASPPRPKLQAPPGRRAIRNLAEVADVHGPMPVVPPGRTRRLAIDAADTYGRVATDLRVSLTDRCNLRCAYCMPAEGLNWLPKPELLTDDEVVRLVRIGGGAARHQRGPLHRRGTAAAPGPDRIVARAAGLRPRPELSLTTNGIGLARMRGPLRDGRAGPGQRLARHAPPRGLPATRPARPAARRARRAGRGRAAGLAPVKVNSVLMRGVNDTEARDLLRFCLAHGYELRFIEQMPLDAQHGWQRANMVTAEEILRTLCGRSSTSRPEGRRARLGPRRDVRLVDGGPARVGVIGSVTRPFCGACDRVRLTADGQVRNCLFAREESDLRGAAARRRQRRGTRRAVAPARWRASCPATGSTTRPFLQPDRPMSAIGG